MRAEGNKITRTDTQSVFLHHLFRLEVGVTDKLLGQLVAVCEPTTEDLREDFEWVRGDH